MKTICGVTLLLALSLCPCKTQAQYIAIPDANFVTWLSNNGFWQCLQGSQLDTTCAAVLNDTSMDCSGAGIQNLYGVQFFKSLKSLNCSNNSTLDSLEVLPDSLIFLNTNGDYNLSYISVLPPLLRVLNCGQNNLEYLPALPDSLRILFCWQNRFTSLPVLPNNLMTLDCSDNSLDSLPLLPASLDTLYCYQDSLKWLPLFPTKLVYLDCYVNQLSTFPPTNGLKWITCDNNQLITFTAFGDSLIYLNCDYNKINILPSLPTSLRFLFSSYNLLHQLPPLPNELQQLGVAINQLDSIGRLPDSLISMGCDFNNLNKLPALPGLLRSLTCTNNFLSYLPPLPDSLMVLECSKNLLNTLPALPDSMYVLFVDSNSDLYCLPKLNRIANLSFTATAITCLPNYGYVTTSNPPLNTVPLCTANNQYGCLFNSITEVAPVSISIYPNPANDFCTLQLDAMEAAYTAKFIDITGREVMTFKITNPATHIPITTLLAGLYFVNVSDKDGRVGVGKLVKE